MRKHVKLRLSYDNHSVELLCMPGQTLMQALTSCGAGIVSHCGGKGVCGKCKVKILEGEVSGIRDAERRYISEDELKSGYRLACKVNVQDGLTVEIQGAAHGEMEIENGCLIPDEKIENDIIIIKKVSIEKPSLNNPTPVFERLSAQAGIHSCCLSALRKVSGSITNNTGMTVYARNGELLALDCKRGKKYGLAVDLGTTTVVAALCEFNRGAVADTTAFRNPQFFAGSDIISRMSFYNKNRANHNKLRNVLIREINLKVKELCKRNGISNEDILEGVIVGNTAMIHILLGLNTSMLMEAPFVPAIKRSLELKAGEIGLKINSSAYVYIPPVIAGFIGSDFISGIISMKLNGYAGKCVFMDFGTNTEVALIDNKSICACSCACGPAFEGCSISSGVVSISGAIDKIAAYDSENDKFEIGTIGNQKPVGICGTGMVDALACFLDNGFMNKNGKILDKKRVRNAAAGYREILISDTREISGEKDITITQKDIREIQLAKGAIMCGLDIITSKKGISYGEVDEIYISGGFGNNLNIKNAVKIGLLPGIPSGRFVQCGNTAIAGACKLLMSSKYRKMAEMVSDQCEYIELSLEKDFLRMFTKAQLFDEK